MDKSLQKNLDTIYELCDKAEALPMSAKSSYGSYRQALKTEFEGVFGYWLLHTDLDEKGTVEFVRDCLDYRITAEAMKRLPTEYPLKSNLKKYTLELVERFIILDNKMHSNDDDYTSSVAHFVYMLLLQMTIEMVKKLPKLSEKSVDFIDDFLKNMQRHVIQEVNFSINASKMNIKDLNKRKSNTDDDEQIIVDLMSLPMQYNKIVFVVNIYQAKERKQHFGMLQNAYIRICDENGQELCRYPLNENYQNMTAMIFGELYRYNGTWKFSAIGQPTTDNSVAEMTGRFR